MSERFELYEFQGQKVLFTGARVQYLKEPVPKGLEKYEIRHSDLGFEACQLARSIWVSHYGTIFADNPIELPSDGYLDFEEETDFIDLGEMMTFEEYQKMMRLESQQVTIQMAP
ncbi:LPD28 domain-containing protein [Anaerorhabdus sp.]|uniref:LPD28 domain-containing protein n=1 Tax=Anaerorhabdus sp. TaxID=1872524 RepID=UPI002FCC3F13